MKISFRIALLVSLFFLPALAHAQSGCQDSPECSTAVLGLVGIAGVALARIRRR